MISRMLSKYRWRQVTSKVPRIHPEPSAIEYFGQFHQDRFVAELLNQQRNGFFVDIGANDGMSINNTYYFEKNLGWSGIAFEPHPVVYQRLAAARKCSTVNAGVGPSNAVMKFSCVDVGTAMLSGFTETFDHSHRRRVKREANKAGVTVHEIDVPTVRLSDAMAEHRRDVIDYLSLDTEGGELEILRSIDFKKLHVRCLSIENNTKNLAIHDYMLGLGFRLAATAGCDELYTHPSVSRQSRAA